MSRPRSRLPLLRLSDLQPGQTADCFAQLADRVRGTTRDGKPFYTCRFRDARRTVSVVLWADNSLFEACQAWRAGDFFKLRGTYSEHDRYGPQFELEQIRPVEDRDRAEGFDERDFLERSRHDPDALFAELDALVVGELRDPALRHLTQNLLHAHAATLKRLPASARHYYPFAGGWLEHTVHVVRNCLFLADEYARRFPDLRPPLNRDLIIAGAVLHDLGRVREWEPTPPGLPVRVSVAGELFGHVMLAHDLIRDAARSIPELKPELLELLLHVVDTHLRLPEWGSPRLPCIPEVLILHHADDLDAKFEMYARCLTRDPTEGPFTERDPVLGRTLLKGRSV